MKDAKLLISELDDRLKELSDKHPEEGKPKFAVLYAVFPFE